MSLSSAVESDKRVTSWRSTPQASGTSREAEPLLGNGADGTAAEPAEQKPEGIRSFLPSISKESRLIMVNLCILFAINAFSSGLAQM